MASEAPTNVPFSEPTRGDGYENANSRVVEAYIRGEDYPRMLLTAGGDLLVGDGTSVPATSSWDPLTADGVSFTPHGTIVATDVQAAIQEVRDKAATVTIPFVIDGGGAVIATGQKGHIEVPFACTINRATLLGDVSGSIVIDIWKDTYANYPPTVADTITAAAKPTLSSATKSQDSTLTGWTTSVTAGDVLAFNVDSASTLTRVLVSLRATRT